MRDLATIDSDLRLVAVARRWCRAQQDGPLPRITPSIDDLPDERAAATKLRLP